MTEFTVQKQDDFIRALLNHSDNFDKNPNFALGYMSMMLHRAINKLPPAQRDLIMSDIDWVIDRHKPVKQTAKAGR